RSGRGGDRGKDSARASCPYAPGEQRRRHDARRNEEHVPGAQQSLEDLGVQEVDEVAQLPGLVVAEVDAVRIEDLLEDRALVAVAVQEDDGLFLEHTAPPEDGGGEYESGEGEPQEEGGLRLRIGGRSRRSG